MLQLNVHDTKLKVVPQPKLPTIYQDSMQSQQSC